jgi:hypothetical protein
MLSAALRCSPAYRAEYPRSAVQSFYFKSRVIRKTIAPYFSVYNSPTEFPSIVSAVSKISLATNVFKAYYFYCSGKLLLKFFNFVLLFEARQVSFSFLDVSRYVFLSSSNKSNHVGFRRF